MDCRKMGQRLLPPNDVLGLVLSSLAMLATRPDLSFVAKNLALGANAASIAKH